MLYPSLHQRLLSQHEAIREIISTLTEERILKRPTENKWNIHENIAHLVQYQPVFLKRIETILTEKNPSFQKYKAEEDAGFNERCLHGLDQLLVDLSADRKKLVNLLESLEAHHFQKTGLHPKYGVLNLSEWTDFFLLHEAHHIFTIFQLSHNISL